MADVRLVKPVAGSQNIVCDPQARFVFDFLADAATLSRSGDNTHKEKIMRIRKSECYLPLLAE